MVMIVVMRMGQNWRSPCKGLATQTVPCADGQTLCAMECCLLGRGARRIIEASGVARHDRDKGVRYPGVTTE
jgi:hypothetical protein